MNKRCCQLIYYFLILIGYNFTADKIWLVNVLLQLKADFIVHKLYITARL